MVLHGHIDVVPGREEQFTPRVDGDRLYGRGAYDMKGGLAAMMGAIQDLKDQRDVRVVLVVVPDEESEEDVERATEHVIANGLHRRLRDHRRAHRPAHRHPGQGRAGDAARGRPARPRTGRGHGWATTPC